MPVGCQAGASWSQGCVIHTCDLGETMSALLVSQESPSPPVLAAMHVRNRDEYKQSGTSQASLALPGRFVSRRWLDVSRPFFTSSAAQHITRPGWRRKEQELSSFPSLHPSRHSSTCQTPSCPSSPGPPGSSCPFKPTPGTPPSPHSSHECQHPCWQPACA